MRKIIRTPLLHATLFVLIAPVPGATPLTAAGSGSTPQSNVPAPSLDPEQTAMDAYNRGIELKEAAAELDTEAAGASGRAADKLANKAAKKWEKAVREFRDATDGKPSMHQAWSELGYALRKSGELDESVAAYDRALSIQPGFPQAVEYRAIAYLRLGRIEDAKAAYMELFPSERALADQLMAAMKAWLESGDGASSEDADSLGDWIEEREQIASQTASLYASGASIW